MSALAPKGDHTFTDFGRFLLRFAAYGAISYTAYQYLHSEAGQKICDSRLSRYFAYPRPLLLTAGALTLTAYEFKLQCQPHEDLRAISRQLFGEERPNATREEIIKKIKELENNLEVF